MNTHQIIALTAYESAIASGNDPYAAIQFSWQTIKRSVAKNLRAPNAFEKIARNTGCRRDYKSPIGCFLEIPGASHRYGSHSAKYKRTAKSWSEAREIEVVVFAWFEKNAKAVTV
jgi:hypothetical protein